MCQWDWRSDVCSPDLHGSGAERAGAAQELADDARGALDELVVHPAGLVEAPAQAARFAGAGGRLEVRPAWLGIGDLRHQQADRVGADIYCTETHRFFRRGSGRKLEEIVLELLPDRPGRAHRGGVFTRFRDGLWSRRFGRGDRRGRTRWLAAPDGDP